MPPEAWMVLWQAGKYACRRAFTDKREAVMWSRCVADDDETGDIRVRPLVFSDDAGWQV